LCGRPLDYPSVFEGMLNISDRLTMFARIFCWMHFSGALWMYLLDRWTVLHYIVWFGWFCLRPYTVIV